ncbi:unnamed protein product [Rhodiola kirilowii]
MSQIASIVFELMSDPGKLPSQTIPKPRGNIYSLAVINKLDATLKESADEVNALLSLNEHNKVKNSKKERELVPIPPKEDFSSTLMS